MNRPFLFALLCFLAVPPAHCQKIEKYFDYEWHDTSAVNARFYRLIEKTDSGWHRRDYYLHNLTLQMEGLYTDSLCTVASGTWRYFHPTRIVESMGVYRGGRKHGLWLQFYSDGLMEDSTVYENDRPVGTRQSWYRNGYPRDSCHYAADGSGVQVAWFDNGQPSFAGRYAAGYRKAGRWQYFYRQGGISATEVYDQQGRMVEKRYMNEDGTVMKDTVSRDRDAEFPGGAKAWSGYLARSLYFPEQYSMGTGDQAAVVVSAVIDEEGRVTDAEVVVPFYPAFDRIALDVVRKSPGWIPAFRHNRKERSMIKETIIFSRKQ